MPAAFKSFFLLFLLLFTGACNAHPAVTFPEGKTVLFLDSLEAAHWVSRDAQEGFFEHINDLERSIQLHTDTVPTVAQYQEFLRRDVRSFSEKQKAWVGRELEAIYTQCALLSPHLLPDTLRLILTRSKYYGPSVYYTREKCIVIPENELRYDSGNLHEVLIHELFHILSRYHPQMRKALYGLIGFTRLEEPVILPESLKRRLLLNPDGSDFQWGIELKGSDGLTVLATPLLFSRYERYNPQRPYFFAHLDYQLFALEKDTLRGEYLVQVSPEGKSTLPPEYFGLYRARSGGNTEYLIHPDEIMADNFVQAVEGYDNPAAWEHFSEEGKALLKAIVAYFNTWEGD
ncbi:MAG: hypothetical protein H6563_08340 [Lewinellaceae bacterium]|nr:hypothetical protein [Lewinellaceae bacterium]